MADSLQLIALLRGLYLRKEGTLSTTDLIPIATEYSVELNELEDYLNEIIVDLPAKKKIALSSKEVNRFLTLQKAIESKNSSPVFQAVAPHWETLKENFRKASPDLEESLNSINLIRKESASFAEKMPKLVKAINEYATLCEKYYANTASLKRLRINIRLLPLAKEALELVEKNSKSLTTQSYWNIAEELYQNNQELFKENLYYFSIIRSFLNEAIVSADIEVPQIQLPKELIIREPEPEVAKEKPETTERKANSLPPKTEEEVKCEKAEEIPVIDEKEEQSPKPSNTQAESLPSEKDIIVREIVPAQEEKAKLKEELESEDNDLDNQKEESAEVSNEIARAKYIPEEKSAIPEKEAVRKEIIPDEVIPQEKEPVKLSTSEKDIPAKKSPKKTLIITGLVVILLAAGTGAFLLFTKKDNKKPVVERTIPEAVDNPATEQGNEQTPTGINESDEPIKQPALPKDTQATQSSQQIQQQLNLQKPTQTAAQPITDKEKENSTGSISNTPSATSENNAFETLLKKAKAGDANSQYRVGLCYEKGDGVSADMFEALTWYRKARVNGSQEAKVRLKELGY